ncbi:hypothetical protein [Thermoflavimicrobium dichotomicum]|uniref:Uncharacterized protein n=1 Tax=Thermoflavimicrobium dichotomicum TaxID=46223 RepID=A0A1I3P6R8_9BACL|nr:hypothetical protein [Thermoflavimicrobium dichotomicum]SFJ17244.1 hypothetical protein SAMN05421852_105114 [Thermoflavimicrobium dichotomicum]
MDKHYQLELAIQDLKRAEHILHQVAGRLELIQHEKSYTLNNLIADFEDLIEELEAKDEV